MAVIEHDSEFAGFDGSLMLQLDPQRPAASQLWRRKVTRNFPPVKGQDATDHDTMHPGLALAFGDLNGVDFWRNKGRIGHVRFVRGPRVEGGRLAFAVEEKYLAPDGTEVCRGTNEFRFVAGETLQPALPGTLLMWSTTLRRADGPLTFGPQHEMGLSFRIATPFVVKGGTGSIVSSHGGKTKRATGAASGPGGTTPAR